MRDDLVERLEEIRGTEGVRERDRKVLGDIISTMDVILKISK